MSLLTQAINSMNYRLQKMVTDPEAEAEAKRQKDEQDKAANAIANAKTDKERQAAEEAAAAEKQKAEADAKDRETFSFTRMFWRGVSIAFNIIKWFIFIALALYGASLATNLNLYREAPIRVLYAIYGFLFFWVVIPYSLLYRWWWMGKKPIFYAFIPLIPYKFNNRYAAMMLSWMSFKPDDQIACLMEWKK